jgi:pimeloyl-ACP methyl ester carboxylesterase
MIHLLVWALLVAADPEDVAFTAKFDGTIQRYVLILPEGFERTQACDVLIALHGHGSDRWQFARPSRSEAKAALDTAAKNALVYVSPDYRARTSWMGPAAEADVVQLIEELRGRYRIGKVILGGASMGGTSALTFAGLHPDLVDGVVALNPTANHLEYENFQDAIAASFGGTKRSATMEYKRRSAEYWPEKLTMPIAITTGGQDALVPPWSALRLSGTLTKIGGNVLHIHREQGGHETNYEDSIAAFEFVLAAVRKSAAP